MHITIRVEIDVEHQEGKFASRDELENLAVEELGSANPQSLDTADGATYEVTEWLTTIEEQPKKKRK